MGRGSERESEKYGPERKRGAQREGVTQRERGGREREKERAGHRDGLKEREGWGSLSWMYWWSDTFAIIRNFMVSVRRTGTFLVYIYTKHDLNCHVCRCENLKGQGYPVMHEYNDCYEYKT